MKKPIIKEVKHEDFTIYYKDLLPQFYNGKEIPPYLLKLRNYVIIALYLQSACTVTGFLCFIIRKLIAYLVINLVSLICLFIGFQGVLQIDKVQVGIHAIITTSIIGIFFLFSVMEAFLKDFKLDELHHSERTVMLLLSLPYLMDFFSGCFSFYFLWKLVSQDTFDEKYNVLIICFLLSKCKEPQQKELELQLIDNYDNYVSDSSNICIICAQREKEVVFYPCGHKVCCDQCGKKLKQQYNSICPVIYFILLIILTKVCRRKISDIIHQY